MNTTQAQQKALDDALVALADHLEFGKCNMRLKTNIKPKKATFQVVLDALALTLFYHAFLITADKKVSLDVDIFRDILHFCLKILGQVFEDLPLEHDILSFIRELGHTRDITYLTDVNVDYLHQPWRAFATVINKCLSGKETRVDKIRLSRAQILWGAPISRRNKIFWHTARDDTMFTSMRCISRHEDTQAPKLKYIRKKADSDTSPKKKPIQGAKGTRLKSKAKVAKPDKKKQPAKKTKAKGLAVFSEVALTKAEQIKLAAKRSKIYFHVSHASGSGDRVDTQSKVLDEQQQKTSGTDKGTGTIPGVPDVPPYESESGKESWGDSEDEDDNDDDGDNDDDVKSDDHDDDSDDERTKSDSDEIPDPNLTNVDKTEYEEEDVDDRVRNPSDYELTDEEKLDDEEIIDDQEDDEVIKKMYGDVNVNLGNGDTEMTDADQGASEQQNVSQELGFEQEEEDAHLLNLENPSPADNEIASLMETSARHATTIPEITFGFTTTTPPPTLFFNPLLQQQTPTFTTTTSTNPTVTLPEIPNFESVFKFDQKMKEAVDAAVQLQTNKLREEAQAENQEFLNQVDSTMKTIIKDQVKAQVSKIMPKIEKYVTDSLGAKVLKILIDKIETNKSINRPDNQKNLYNVLVESYNSDKDIITSYSDVVILKKGRDDQDKDENPSAGSDRGTKRRKSSKDTGSFKDSRSKEKKSSSTSKDASQSQQKSYNKSAHAEEPSHIVKDSSMQQDQEFIKRDNNEQPVDKEVTKADCQVARAEEPPTSVDEFNDTSFDFSAFVLNQLKIPNLTQEILKKLTNLIIDEWYDLNVALCMFTRRIVIQGRVEDLQLGIESYQKKLNLTKPDTYRPNLKNKTAYTSHSDPHGITYMDQFKRNRLMHTDELHKFSDDTLNDVQTALHDIAAGIRMEYLPIRKWSNLDKKRARVM
ncbi:hypothetical protein Tco_0896926, partial [Tanacetum coccineum]